MPRSLFKNDTSEIGEMGKQLRVLVALAEELGSIANTLMIAHGRPKNFF